MLKKLWICIGLLMIIPALLFTTSCAKKAVNTGQVVEEATHATEEDTAEIKQKTMPENQAEEDLKTAQLAEQAAKEEEIPKAKMASMMLMNEDIYFDYDSSVLKSTARELLIRKSEWLHMNPDASVIIEGHCDERGTTAYNIALGDRRAQSAKAFFVDVGIQTNQISTISYGEERPVETAQNEDAWSKNRRAHFVIE